MQQPNSMPEKSESIEKFRELLFGQHFKDHEKQLHRIEEKLKRDIEALRNEISMRLTTLEDIQKGILRDFESFKKSTSKVETELRQSIMDSTRDLTQGLSKNYESLKNELEMEFKLLDEEKINKGLLSSMLGEIVMRLNDHGHELKS